MPAPAGPTTPETAAPGYPDAPELTHADLRRDDPDGSAPTGWGAGDLMTPLELSETERKFKFRGLPQAVGAARRVLREWERQFDPVLFYDLSLCVSELVTNRVQNGDPALAAYIELTVRRCERLVRAEISEPCDDVVMATPSTITAGDWGVFIVDRVADRWGVDHGSGTLVWCEIDLAQDGRSRSAPAAHPPL